MTKVVFWDVQHGNAAYVETPGRKRFVVDLGTGKHAEGNPAFSPLRHLKYRWNVARLDAVIVTHPHRDHIDDISNFGLLSPGTLYRPRHLTERDIRGDNPTGSNPTIDAYLSLNNRYTTPIGKASDPFAPENNGGPSVQTFVPNQSPTSNLNNHSIVTIVSHAGSKIVIPGDNEAASWRELLGWRDFREAIRGTDILLAPHHGRQSGFSKELFRHIEPRLTVISDGPLSGTSATASYAGKTSGWVVQKRSGGTEKRKVVTTRRDGVVVVDIGRNQRGRFIQVTVD
jgi:competence protein ComEC